MRITLRILAVASALALPTQAFAWAYPGHRIVGAIADLVLKAHNPEVYKKVQALLTIKGPDDKDVKRTLSEVAIFPDCAKNDVQFCGRPPTAEEIAYANRNKGHGAFHFTDVPIEQHRYNLHRAGTSDTDVVQMIEYAVAQLRGKSPPQKQGVNLTDPEAVWLLAHLVGDIHQPLHVGAKYYDKTCRKGVDPNKASEPPDFGIDKTIAETQGGNKILLTAKKEPAVGPTDQLHLFWDLTAVAQAMQAAGLHDSEQDFASLLAGKAPDGWKTPGDVSTWAAKWANDVIPVAAEAHRRLSIRRKGEPEIKNGKLDCRWQTTLDKSYRDWAKEQARTQLAKAGFRLAALFVAIFAEEAKKDEENK